MYGTRRFWWDRFDVPLMVAVLLLTVFGLLMVRSAVGTSVGLQGAVERQIIFVILGLVLCAIAASVDYRLVTSAWGFLYGIGLAGLLAVLVVGAIQHGGQRWIEIAGFTYQPSETMKLILVVALAQYLGPRMADGWRFHYILVSGLILAIPVAMVYAQPDLGTSIVMIVVWLGLVFIAGVKVWQMGLLALLGAVASPLIWMNLQPYMQDRVRTLLQPESNPDSAFVVDQALIAVGSGSIWGQGYGNGSQSQLHFLRVRHTDFIFSVIGEELGFVGAVLTLALIAFICLRLLRIAQTAPDGTGRLVSAGVAVIIGFHAFVSVGMNIGILPVKGLPLPFISVGGSSIVANFIGIGMAQSVALRRT